MRTLTLSTGSFDQINTLGNAAMYLFAIDYTSADGIQSIATYSTFSAAQAKILHLRCHPCSTIQSIRPID